MHFCYTRKRLGGEPCGSLTVLAFINATAQASSIDLTVIRSRNEPLSIQLRNREFSIIDVEGDGNCFFRVLSVSLHGHQHCHAELRATVARHVDKHANLSVSSDDVVALLQLATSAWTATGQVKT